MPRAGKVQRKDSDSLQVMKYFTDGNPHTVEEIANRMYATNAGVIMGYIADCVEHGLLTTAPLPNNERKGFRATELGKVYYLWSPLKKPAKRKV